MSKNLQKPKGLLIDLDGTLYHGSSKIEGADRLIASLRERGYPYLFVTNNSASSPEEVAERLRGMGIPAEAHEVCTSAQATAGYAAEEYGASSVFVIGESGLREQLQLAGHRLTEEAPELVVQGIDREVTYERLAKAVQYIRGGAVYLLTNPDLLLPSTNGLIPGAGSIGAMLKAASGCEPILIGKPSPILMNYALERLGVAAGDTWVVGDNIATDIAAGIAAGCTTVLVLTGLTNSDNYELYAQQAGCKPDAVCGTLYDFISYL
ncbi:TIGR01457 family HAD-type hydrolase [Paenibacillus sp. GCM10027627]|uniref:TIGR01457 family HAD-type hydrolase n=1 Tax=unclassified Paenibacillus TaxID=185978 RepID=UPI0036336DBF